MRSAWLLLCFLPLAASAAPWVRSEGVAATPQGETLYREVHWQREAKDGAERWVLYQCPDGRPFARKHLPATSRPQARGYLLEDRRSGQRAEVQAAGNRATIDWKEDAASTPRQRQLELPPEAVIDAGFDAAVRLHWAALMRGERVTLPFLAAGRQRFYQIQLRHGGAVRWQGQEAHAIEVSLDAWYGSLAPRLSLVYADADRRLLEFRGISNLRDPRGAYPQVVVRFAAAPAERSAAEWQAAWTQPLVERCSVTTR
ncbi:hypothetical protein P6166_02295 [Stenotrophomonas sp. HITSZ_GD]|uniref:hypothetical protein n=1 Tax=Stenotrophomonas sp. HITSZ_GD TaxID=3037248 RepID=UPI00240CE981|nr:hypothetical protein [Stenotrophomonas sp. HITSZ_GD]MDG2524188.1 hypothetical protein [Stenotrophomonas sp. HITSZ_GD]